MSRSNTREIEVELRMLAIRNSCLRTCVKKLIYKVRILEGYLGIACKPEGRGRWRDGEAKQGGKNKGSGVSGNESTGTEEQTKREVKDGGAQDEVGAGGEGSKDQEGEQPPTGC